MARASINIHLEEADTRLFPQFWEAEAKTAVDGSHYVTVHLGPQLTLFVAESEWADFQNLFLTVASQAEAIVFPSPEV